LNEGVNIEQHIN